VVFNEESIISVASAKEDFRVALSKEDSLLY